MQTYIRTFEILFLHTHAHTCTYTHTRMRAHTHTHTHLHLPQCCSSQSLCVAGGDTQQGDECLVHLALVMGIPLMTVEGTNEALFTYSHITFTPLSNREKVKDLIS